MVKRILGIIIFLFSSSFSYATHQVGGYISFKCLGGYTYQVTITNYTNTYLTSADRDGIRVYWGDGQSDSLTRLNGPTGISTASYPGGDPTPNGVPICNYDFNTSPPTPLNGARKINVYQGIHTYQGPGNYHVYMYDPDRMAYVNNITNSVDVIYYMYSTLIITPYAGCINSPVITNPPVCQYGCTGLCYTYNPGAYIPDIPPGSDDSISYSLGSSLTFNPNSQTGEEVAQGYYNPGATIDPVRGTLTWCNPSTGIWNFVILMTTYKRIYIDSVKTIVPADTVELELEVVIQGSCANPTVTSKDTCVVAGGDVSITYTATVGNQGPLYVTAAGEPFSLSPAATFSNNSPAKTVEPVFQWLTNCNEIRENPYEVVVKATEKTSLGGIPPDTAFSSAYGTSLITVVGPPPKHLIADAEGTTVCLHWGPSGCTADTVYNIYRGTGCINWKHGYCETGVPSYTGYTLIATNHGINDTTYCDSNKGAGLSPGVAYSYIVDGSFPLPDGSESYASNDTCIVIKLGVPLITNVSVTKTDPAEGKIFIRWMKPLANDTDGIDTTQYPGPYQYELMHATGMNNESFSTLETINSPYFRPAFDTTFMDTGLNTQQNSYNYKVNFYCKGGSVLVGSSGSASSVYLGVRRGGHRMTLNWSAEVPWSNDTFDIYRQLPSTIGYQFLAKTTNTSYIDSGLSNGYPYCYYVKSISEYTAAPHIEHPLYDSSETICGTPEDTIPPCSPPLNVVAKCDLYEDSIIWSNPDRLCPEANKVVSYQIFYTPVENGDMSVIATINNPQDTLYVNSGLTSVAGCYAVIAFDSVGQTSPFNTICVDNCPTYRLPNVFTPNGDLLNDLFGPLEPYRYVQSIDINIYNRWGQVMFHTTDPSINWNGNVNNSGGPCPDGVYYYICVVNEIRVTGIVPVTLKGFIQLVR